VDRTRNARKRGGKEITERGEQVRGGEGGDGRIKKKYALPVKMVKMKGNSGGAREGGSRRGVSQCQETEELPLSRGRSGTAKNKATITKRRRAGNERRSEVRRKKLALNRDDLEEPGGKGFTKKKGERLKC